MRCVLLLQEARPAFGRPERELHIDRCACIPRFSVHWPTHGRLSRLLGRLAHARHGHTAVRCARVAHELRAGPIRPTARSMRAAQVPAARCSPGQLQVHGRLSRLLGRPIHARRAGDAVRCVRVAQELRRRHPRGQCTSSTWCSEGRGGVDDPVACGADGAWADGAWADVDGVEWTALARPRPRRGRGLSQAVASRE